MRRYRRVISAPMPSSVRFIASLTPSVQPISPLFCGVRSAANPPLPVHAESMEPPLRETPGCIVANVRLNHVALPARNVESSAGFYVRLGLTQIVANYPYYARLLAPNGDTTLSLHQAGEAVQNGASMHFEVEDVDRTVQQLKQAGFQFMCDPVDQPYLWREAILHDPDGHRIFIFHAGENRIDPPWRLRSLFTMAELSAATASDPLNSADSSLVDLVEAVRALRYGRPGDRTVEGMLRERRGTCSTKHLFLAARLAERFPETDPLIVHRVYRLDRATARRHYGDPVAEAVPEDGLVDVHRYLTIHLDGQRVTIDATFPGPRWDGRSALPLACGEGDDYPVGGRDPDTEKQVLEREHCDPAIRERFIAALSVASIP